MTNEDIKKLNDDICLLAEKYKLHHVSFCAIQSEEHEKQFIGVIGCDVKDSSGYVNSILLVGRL